MTLSWQEPPDDGGSTIEGFKVQWKSGAQEYDASRQATVTDLTITVQVQTISGLTNDVSHTVQVLAYNHNGDGVAAETTVTPTATDTTAPVLLLAPFERYWVRLIWSEALDESSVPPSTAFTVTVNGVSRDGNVEVNGNVVSLGGSGGVNSTDVLTVSYTAPTGSGAKPLRDAAGNKAADFSNQSVRNDKIQVAITSDPGSDKTYSYNSGYGKQDFIEVTVTFGEPVIVNGLPEIQLEVGSNTRRAAYHSGSGTSSLVFRYPVTQRDTDSDGIFIGGSGRGPGKLTGPGVVRYASTRATVPARMENSLQSDHLVDGVRPTLVSADIVAGGKDLDLRWDKALDEDSATGSFLFTVENSSDNSSLEITAVSIQGQVVTLTLSSAVSATDQLTVSYYDPFGHVPESLLMEINHKPLKDTVGNAARKSSSSVSITQNPNSPPEFPTAEDGARSVDENAPARRNIGAPIRATDADSNRLTYSISGADAASFDVVASSGRLRTKSPLDYESRDTYSFTMSVTDGLNVYSQYDATVDDTITVTVTVNDVDEGPDIAFTAAVGVTANDSALTVDENFDGTLATFSGSDPENAPGLTYTWSLAGTDAGDFAISETGVLSFASAPDYERPADSGGNNVYDIIVRALDSSGKAGSIALTVTVSPVNEPPEFPAAPVAREVARDAEEGDRVSSPVTASDVDQGDGLTYSLVSGFPFDVEPATGQIVVAAGAPEFDENVPDSYTVTIVAQDQDGARAEIEVTINVVEQPPPRTTGGGGGGGGFGPAPVAPKFSDGFRTTRTVAQNARAGDVIGDPVAATHPEDLEITYSLSGSHAESFTVDEETGQIRVKEGMALELGQTYTVNLTATDSAGFGAIIIVMIEVTEASLSPYDRNANDKIERDEVIMAVADYFKGSIEKEEVIEVIKLYFSYSG